MSTYGLDDKRTSNWWRLCQPHPGTRRTRLGCYLPVLTRSTRFRCGRTNRAPITTRRY